MRISAELLSYAEQRTNPLNERELVLQGLGIPVIENMGIARDDYDSWDFSNNRIVRVDNFPRVSRLRTLLLSGNCIESLDPINLQRNVPNLTTVSLSYNNISSLVEIANIGKSFPQIEFLTLNGNPVTKRQYYRLYAIHKMPTLKSLDYNKVNRSERETAARLARSAAGAALESDVQREWYSITNGKDDNTAGGDYNNVKTFIPGEGILSLGDDENGTPSKATAFTAEQKQQIRDLLANASSVKEVEEIENSVRKGILPERLMKRSLPSDVDDDNNERDTKIQKIPTATI